MRIRTIRAARVHKFGGPDAIVNEAVTTSAPARNQILVRLKAAGVGTNKGLTQLAELLEAGQLTTAVDQARLALEMLAGKPH